MDVFYFWFAFLTPSEYVKAAGHAGHVRQKFQMSSEIVKGEEIEQNVRRRNFFFHQT